MSHPSGTGCSKTCRLNEFHLNSPIHYYETIFSGLIKE